MLDVNKLIKEKREIWYQAQDLRKQVENDNRLLTKEEVTMYDALVDKMNDIQRNIDTVTDMNQRANVLKENVYDSKGTVIGTREEEAIKYNRAIDHWMRVGNRGLNQDELKILRPDSSDAGSSMIELRTDVVVATAANTQQTDVITAVEISKNYYAPWLKACDEITTATGNPITWPKVDEAAFTGSVEVVTSDMFNTTDNITFSSSTLNAYFFSSQGVKVNKDNLEDSAFPLATVVGKIQGDRLWRAISTACTTGSGTATCSGIVGKTVGAPVGVIAGKCVITRARLLQLMGKVNYAYHLAPGAGWMFNSAQMYEIAGLSSSTTDNRPLWQPSMVAGVPDKLEGFPYYINNDLSLPTTYGGLGHNAVRHILFGDFKSFKVRYAGPLQMIRLDERYAETLQVGFVAIQRMDSKLIAGNATTYAPIKYLRKSYS